MTIMAWIGTVLVWLTFFYQIWTVITQRRRLKRIRRGAVEQIAADVKLDPVQVQCALDASQALFEQRVREMGGRP